MSGMKRLARRWNHNELLDYSKYHLGYEISMFLSCGLTLQNTTAHQMTQSQRNLLIEGFGIHLRALLEFFCRDDNAQGVRPDDVLASDYMCATPWILPQLPQATRCAWKRVNKEIGHLTASRKNDSDPSKDWMNTIEAAVSDVVRVCRDFLQVADPHKLAREVRDIVSKVEIKPNDIRDCCTTTSFTFMDAGTSRPLDHLEIAPPTKNVLVVRRRTSDGA
jgi:hypothetical protein